PHRPRWTNPTGAAGPGGPTRQATNDHHDLHSRFTMSGIVQVNQRTASGRRGITPLKRGSGGLMPRDVSKIAVLIFNGVPMFETSVPISVFGMDRTSSGAPRFSLLPVAAEGGPLISTGGIQIHAPYGLDDLREVGIVMIPSWRDPQEPVPESSLEAIRAVHADGAVVAGLCMGAFVLAATGLLDGRRA